MNGRNKLLFVAAAKTRSILQKIREFLKRCIMEKKLFDLNFKTSLMSHGCSIHEIRKVIGVKEFVGGNEQRVMFLLENPG